MSKGDYALEQEKYSVELIEKANNEKDGLLKLAKEMATKELESFNDEKRIECTEKENALKLKDKENEKLIKEKELLIKEKITIEKEIKEKDKKEKEKLVTSFNNLKASKKNN